jgi:predicted dehydrogenase
VGLGNIGHKRLAALGGACVATVDPFNPAADYAHLTDCPDDRYDAAVLCVPNDVKIGLIHSLLSQRKHVLVEKPLLFTDEDEAGQLEATADCNSAVWYTAYNHRFEPSIATMKGWLDQGRIGEVYNARLFYGNGTVGNVIGTFRDRGLGVIEDLGSHLLDLSAWLFGETDDVRAVSVQRHEGNAPDHAILQSHNGRIELEVSFLSWKNTFTIDVLGSRGSAHLNGLRKWGGAELIFRERMLPSGVPREQRQVSSGRDETWTDELWDFEERVRNGRSSFDGDRWISGVLRRLT